MKERYREIIELLCYWRRRWAIIAAASVVIAVAGLAIFYFVKLRPALNQTLYQLSVTVKAKPLPNPYRAFFAFSLHRDNTVIEFLNKEKIDWQIKEAGRLRFSIKFENESFIDPWGEKIKETTESYRAILRQQFTKTFAKNAARSLVELKLLKSQKPVSLGRLERIRQLDEKIRNHDRLTAGFPFFTVTQTRRVVSVKSIISGQGNTIKNILMLALLLPLTVFAIIFFIQYKES